jgi:hypothetical protein
MDSYDNNGRLSSSIDTYTSNKEQITTNTVYRETGKPAFTTVTKRDINTGEVSFAVYYRPQQSRSGWIAPTANRVTCVMDITTVTTNEQSDD